MKKGIILIVMCIAAVTVPGLLRLHEGQIQEQKPDGEWECADAKIREIVNSGGSYLTFVDSNLATVTIEPPHSWSLYGDDIEVVLEGDLNPSTYFKIKKPVWYITGVDSHRYLQKIPVGTKCYFDPNDL